MVAENQAANLVGRIARNAVANYIGQFVVMGIGFLITPFVVHRLGDSQYGIWGLTGSVVAYLTLLDLGFSAGAARFIARFEGEGRRQEISILISTLWWVYCGLGAVALSGAAAVTLFLPHLFRIEPTLVQVACVTLLLAGLHLALHLPTSLFNAILVGEQRIDLNNVASIVGRLIEAALTVALVSLGWGAVALAVASIVATSVIAAVRRGIIQRMLPWLRMNWRSFDQHILRQVLSFSAFVFGLQVTGLIAFNTDNIVLATFLSAASITPFALSYKLANLLTQVTQPLVNVLFPAFAEMQGRKDLERSRLLFIEGTQVSTVISLLLGLILIFGADQILRMWVGEQYASSFRILQLLAFSNLTIAAVGSSSSNLLLGYGRVRAFFLITVGHAVANLGLSVFLVAPLQGEGVALGTVIPVSIANLFFIFPLGCRTAGIPVWQGYHRILWPTLWPAFFAIAVYTGLKLMPGMANQPLFCLAGMGLSYLLCYMLLSSGRYQSVAYLRRFRQAMNLKRGTN